MNNATVLINKMINHFNVSTLQALANEINTTQSAISKWRLNNNIDRIAKKCKELRIYNEIFNDFNLNKENKKDNIFINEILLEKINVLSSSYGLSINAYVEYLILEDLKRINDKLTS
jgi:hypothetical protein